MMGTSFANQRVTEIELADFHNITCDLNVTGASALSTPRRRRAAITSKLVSVADMSAMAAMSSLTSLDLSYNSIYGNLPKWLGDMSSNFHTVGGSRLEQLEQLASHALAPGAPAVQSSSQLLYWHVASVVGQPRQPARPRPRVERAHGFDPDRVVPRSGPVRFQRRNEQRAHVRPRVEQPRRPPARWHEVRALPSPRRRARAAHVALAERFATRARFQVRRHHQAVPPREQVPRHAPSL